MDQQGTEYDEESLAEENTVDYSNLEIILVELGGLENDVTSHTIAVCRLLPRV